MDAEGLESFRLFVDSRSSALLRTAVLLSGGDRHAGEDPLQNALAKAGGRRRRIDEPEAYVRQVLCRQQISRWRLKWILDPRTGRRLVETHGRRLLSRADESSLAARDIGPDGDEFHQRLVLVTVGSDKVVPLSGFRGTRDGTLGRWEPVFADR
ncbi:hypothetical protein ABT330_25915 [Streptomyces sp. NPDC000658]|uniref:hypothetical protein n=1 Tax=Streptomyces sp. NPDC000658 TaxID=3154266 RepID=UPI0033223FAF